MGRTERHYQWSTAGEVREVGADPFQGTWFWPGPRNQAERDEFWRTVQRHDCVVYEGLHNAIIGLVWQAGVPGVAYDVDEVWKLMVERLQVSVEGKTAQAVLEGEQEVLRNMLKAQHAYPTPWFRHSNSTWKVWPD